ncbi:pilus assembly protein TadG-related protein [uncultured Hyphomicrobium sp.]|uniref:pilus assembly protein TadG-related protein n=1 Tax=uncultured Hyphomicrobium sp. TaxID=194373 RepID=UPI0025FAB85F|nr:pilus assembly protein TadG-related protein [uncultured Hyphomicrobium sp.]
MFRGSLLSRVISNCEGSIAVVMAMFFTVCITLCALAIDMGSLYLERRTVQGAADLAAVAAASDLDHAEAAARATLNANGFDDIHSLAVVKGRYSFDPEVQPGARFQAGLQPYNAVRLDVAMGGQLYFAKSFMSEPEISVAAIGTTDAQAVFSIGSRLASINGGILNALISALLGGNVSLSAMDYNALVNANVSLDGFLSALATDIGVTAGTYSNVLDSEVTVGNVLNAAVRSANDAGEAAAAQVVTTLLGQTVATATVPLRALVDLGPFAQAEIGQAHAGLAADVNLMSLLSAAAQLANGQNQVAVNLGAGVPGLLSLKLDLAIGEAAQNSGWVAVGQPGATVRTAQTRLRLVAEVGGTGLLAGIRIRLPIYIDIASAEARLKSLTCNVAQPGSAKAVIEARPAVVRAWIGDVASGGLSSFGSSVPVSRAAMVQAPLVTVSASAYAEMANVSATDLSFTQSDVDGHVIKTAKTHDFLSSLVASLLQSVDLQVNVVGFGLGVSAVKGLLIALLTPVAAALDPVLATLLETLGVSLGEVDVQTHGIRCGSAVLAG